MSSRILFLALGIVVIVTALFVLIPSTAGPEPTPTPVQAPTEDASDVRESSAAAATATLQPVEQVQTPATAAPSQPDAAQSPLGRPGVAPPQFTYEVIAEFPHDPNAFTQGLVYTNSVLYEGTGLYGRSSLREVDLESGEPTQVLSLPEEYFGEGITVFDGKVFQLTWKSQRGFIYDADDFAALAEFRYPTEGWGLTHDGTQLIMSDGTAYLYMRDPETLEETGRVLVQDHNGPVVRLNELEYVKGEVLANVWQTDRIARIDPNTGRVTAWIDMTGLLPAEDRSGQVDVLNGIAYDAENDRLFVTGKLWPKLYQVELIPVE